MLLLLADSLFRKQNTLSLSRIRCYSSARRYGASAATLASGDEDQKVCSGHPSVLDQLNGARVEVNCALYASLLRQCSNEKALAEGKLVHKHIVQSKYKRNAFLGNLLLQMYGNCGSPEEARAVFQQLAERNVYSWNLMVAAYAQNGHLQEARTIFDHTPCRDIVTWTAMLGAYAQNGHLQHATHIFNEMPDRNVVSWTAMVTAYTQNGHPEKGLTVFQILNLEGIKPDRVLFLSVLDACASIAVITEGKRVHEKIAENGLESDPVLGTAIVNMYGKCGCPDEAKKAFDSMARKNVVAWNAMIATYAQNGHLETARSLFDQIPQPNAITWNTMITGYAQYGHLEDVRTLFDRMPQPNVVSNTAMLTAYAQNGHLQEARSLFDEMLERNVVSWNAMIAAYSQEGYCRQAIRLFQQMDMEGVRCDSVTFISILDSCANSGFLKEGRVIHASIVDTQFHSDNVVGTGVVNMYAKCGCLEAARVVFEEMPERGRISWNAMVAAHARNGHLKEANGMFNKMPERDVITWTSMLTAYAQDGQLQHARSLFEVMPERNVVSWNAMIAAYAQNGHLQDARNLFDRMPLRDLVSWNAMVAGYAQNECGKEAIQCFQEMDLESSLLQDKVTFISVLDACAILASLSKGRALHSRIIQTGLDSDIVVGNAVVNMYAKCGSLDDSWSAFEQMSQRNVISWNAMVAAYAQNGYNKVALELFRGMQLEAVKPDGVTFMSVLHACSHAGLVRDGVKYFVSMSRDYDVESALDHYICMVDLLGRAGQLERAEELIKHMPFEPDIVTWTTFLSGCKMHNDIDRGQRCADLIVKIDHQRDSSPYVQLSNIHAVAGKNS